MRKCISYLVVLLFLFGSLNTHAQFTDVWHFGDSSALQFTDTGVVSLTNSVIASGESASSICDSLGNILFYTNGFRVWNRNDELMLNGDSLKVYQSFSVSQGVLILPHPILDSHYFVFTLHNTVTPGSGGLSYSEVDMNLDGGLGGVVPVYKNINLTLDTLDEQMTAIRHGNGRDWWLLLQGYNVPGEHLEFYEFLVSEDGISGPIIQDLGYDTLNIYVGEMVASPKGDIIAVGTPGIQLFDFDRCSGTVSNPRVVVDSALTGYGMAFSEDGSKLYTCDLEYVYQIDFTYQGSDTTVELIFDLPWNAYQIGQIERGPDGMIYVVIATGAYPNYVIDYVNTHMSVIRQPNLHGLACQFDTLAVPLSGRNTFGLPNHVNYNLGPLVGSPCDTLSEPTSVAPPLLQPEKLISVFPNPTNSGNLFIDLTQITETQALHLTIVDMQGKRSLNQTIQAGGIETIDVSGLAKGQYILSIEKENSSKLLQKLILIE